MIQVVVEVKDVRKEKDTLVPTLFFYGGNYYDIREPKKFVVIKQPTDSEPKPEKLNYRRRDIKNLISLGPIIAKYGTFSIRENVLYAVRDAFYQKKSIAKVMKKYYQKARRTTRNSYAGYYIRHMRKVGFIPDETVLSDATQKPNKGKMIYRMNHTSIFENVYNDLIPVITGEKPNTDAVTIFRKYKYKASEDSIMTVYLGAYRRFYDMQSGKPFKQQKLIVTEPEPETKTEQNTKTFDRGKVLATYGKNHIYENIYSLVLPEFSKPKMDKSAIRNIFEYTYQKPNGDSPSKSSKNVYLTLYKQYYDVMNGQTPQPEIQSSENHTKRKYRKQKPENAHGYLKERNLWIYNDEYEKVKRAVHKFGFVATSKTIEDETGLDASRINHVLCYLKNRHEIYLTYVGRTPVYHPAITGKEEI